MSIGKTLVPQTTCIDMGAYQNFHVFGKHWAAYAAAA